MELSNELHFAREAAVNAGKAIAEFYGKKIPFTEKAEDHPLTQADLAANAIIKETLSREFPRDAWLSEEDADQKARLEAKRVWIVDPLDGTKDFINENPEFAVSIALVENNEPVVGAVYNPITKELFSAVKNGGATLDGNPISTKSYSEKDKINLLVSQSEYKRGEWQEFEEEYNVKATGGCAYKMSKIAKGDADGTFTLQPKSEWDICAGTLILKEAGGIVKNLDGTEVKYNQKNVALKGLVYCNCQSVYEKLMRSVKRKS